MPITIRPSVVKIKKPSTGEYREINALLDTDSAKTVYYGVSSTAAGTQTKTVTIEGISALSDGLLVRILFANAQSYSGVPKLMINSTAASNIKTRRGTDATNLTWKAGDVLDFVYDSSSSGFIVLDKGDIEELNGAISGQQAQITGNIETSTTASKTYAVGDFLSLNNILYVVHTAIPQGTTLVPGTNILSTNVGSWLPMSDWFSLTLNSAEQGSGASATLYYFGNIVSISFLTVSRKHAEDDVILTVPTGYRPSNAIEFVAGEGNYVLHLRVLQNGNVVVYLPSDNPTGGRVYGSVIFWSAHLT